jgi:hypothetical protein
MGFALFIIICLLLVLVFGVGQVAEELQKLNKKDTITIREEPFHVDPERYNVAYFVIGNENTQKNAMSKKIMQDFLCQGYTVMRTTPVGDALHYILTKYKRPDYD